MRCNYCTVLGDPTDWNLGEDSFLPRVVGFIQIVSDKCSCKVEGRYLKEIYQQAS